MIKFNNFNAFKNIFTLFMALCIFISGFYILGYIYFNNSSKFNAVVIKNSVFSDSNLRQRVQNFEVNHVEQVKVYNIYYNKYEYIDNNSLEVMVYNSQRGMPELAVFNKYDNNISYLDTDKVIVDVGKINTSYIEQKFMANLYGEPNSYYNEFHQEVSPDGKKILQPLAADGYKIGTKLYDISKSERSKLYDEAFPLCWLPDSSGFIGVNDKLFLQNIRNGKKRVLLDMSKITGNSNQKVQYDFSDKVGKMDLGVSKDGKNAYISYKNPSESNSTDLWSVSLSEGSLKKTVLPALIDNIIPMNSNKLMMQGKMGIFLYDIKEKKLKNIIGHEVLSFQVSPDGEKVAYTKQNKNGRDTDIHVAYVNSGNLSNDEVIYTDHNYISAVRWTRDSRRLSCIVDGTIYEFSFKNM